jgi:hypothetical protein
MARTRMADRVMSARIQLRRTAGWRKPPNTVVVSRPSTWENPYRIVKGEDLIPLGGEEVESGTGGRWHVVVADEWSHQEYPVAAWETEEQARASAVEHYRYRATEAPGHFNFVLWKIDALRGKNLACWCPLDQPCHADVLLELANAPVVSS